MAYLRLRQVCLVAPTRDGTAAGRFLERQRGLGGYMIILDCDDAERRRRHAEQLGIRVAHLVRYENYFGVQLHPRDTGAALIEFNHTDGGERLDRPYHPAGPNWQTAQRTDVALRLAAVGIEAPDPQAFSARWATLMERPATLAQGCYRIALDDGDIRFSQCPAAARGYPAHEDAIALCGVNIVVS